MNLSTMPWNTDAFDTGFNPVAKGESRNKGKIRDLLYNKHFQEYMERYKWEGLPDELPSDIIERILFFRFKGMFFKFNDKHYFLPFALKGTIDPYGRYESVVPTLFTGQWDEEKGKFDDDMFLPSTVSEGLFKVRYNLNGEQSEWDTVILTDQSLHISQDRVPAAFMISPLISQLTDILVLVNIDLMSSAKVYTIVAPDQETKTAIEQEMAELDDNIMNGKRFVVLTGSQAAKLDELQGSSAKDSARYFQTYQSLDNLRKEILGVEGGSTFQKMEHMTDNEVEVNASDNSVLNNGLRMRQEFAELINHYFNLNVTVDCHDHSSEDIIGEESSQTGQLRGDDEDGSI